MKKNQRGFSTIETVLIVVIVGVIGGVGWFVYNSQKKTSQTLDKTAQSQGEPQKSAVKPTDQQKLESDNGTIKGSLGYPSESIPAQRVCAEDVAGKTQPTCINTASGQLSYELKVSAGTYYVYASLQQKLGDITQNYLAYYDEFVRCGMNANCPSAGHKQYIAVEVKANQTVDKIDPTDWYNTTP